MKNIFLITFFLIMGFALLAISYAPYAAMAQVRLETGLPNIPGDQLPVGQELPFYIKYLFIFGLGAIAILALGQMIIGGIQYILAAGSVIKHEEAKDTIQQALLGLGLLLVSYLLLNTINPDLVNLKTPNPPLTQFKGQPPPGVDAIKWLRNYYLADEAAKESLKDLSTQPNGTRITTDSIRATKMGNGNLLICDSTGNNCTWSLPITK